MESQSGVSEAQKWQKRTTWDIWATMTGGDCKAAEMWQKWTRWDSWAKMTGGDCKAAEMWMVKGVIENDIEKLSQNLKVWQQCSAARYSLELSFFSYSQ
jgi:hypothetical protein